MRITAKPNPGRAGFRCTFQDPRDKKVSSYGLGTQESTEAQRICNDIVTIFSKTALIKDKKNPALLAYHRRAIEIVHGPHAAEVLFNRKVKPVLEQEDIDTLGARIVAVVQDTEPGENVAEQIDLILKEFESQRYKELQDRFEQLENRLKVVEPTRVTRNHSGSSWKKSEPGEFIAVEKLRWVSFDRIEREF